MPDPVVHDPRPIRKRKQALIVTGDTAFRPSGLRNDVAREGNANEASATIRDDIVWVVDLSASGQPFAEISSAHFCGWNRQDSSARCGPEGEPRINDKEEGLVLAVIDLWQDQRSAEREPVLILLRWIGLRGSPAARIENLIAQILENVAMQLVSSRLGYRCYPDATISSVLGVIGGVQAQLGDRFGGRVKRIARQCMSGRGS